MARRDIPLRRDTDDKKIAGVCSGLARYFDVDTTLVRVIFVVLALVGGGAVIAYALLWWLLDPVPDTADTADTADTWPAPAGTDPSRTSAADTTTAGTDRSVASGDTTGIERDAA